MSDDQDPSYGDADTVLIVGAGLSGLAIAQGLKKAGIKYLVFEREPANLQRARDWNIGLHWGAPILQTLLPSELFAQLDSCQVDPSKPCPPEDTIRFLNAQSGDQIGASTLPHFYRIIRSKLRTLLATGISIQYSKSLDTILYSEDGETVSTSFEDGSNYTGCVLVGTDGPRSTVRSSLVGREKTALTALPFAASIVQARYTADQVRFLRSFHPLYIAGIHPAGQMAWVGLHSAQDIEKPEEWIMNHYISFPISLEEQEKTKDWSNEMRLKQLKGWAEGYSEPWKSAFGWLSEDQPVWYAPLTQWDPSLPEHVWDNQKGRVTLAGDAAHPMTFQRGQGLNSALKDALEIVNQLSTFLPRSSSVINGNNLSGQTNSVVTREEAIGVYEVEMKARTGLEVRLSAENTRMVHHWNEVMESPLIKQGLKKA